MATGLALGARGMVVVFVIVDERRGVQNVDEFAKA